MNVVTFKAILESLIEPVVFVDTQHIIRYVNPAATAFYAEGRDLVGRSLLDCHNETSRKMIIEILAAFEQGETERLITDNEKHQIFMRVVRDPSGKVLGYYERYAPPKKQTTLESGKLKN